MSINPALAQRRAALTRANEIRNYRAQMKQRFRAHRPTVVEVQELILDPPPELETMLVSRFLRAIPTVGVAKQNIVTKRLRIYDTTTLRGLTEGQRGELAAAIEEWAHLLHS